LLLLLRRLLDKERIAVAVFALKSFAETLMVHEWVAFLFNEVLHFVDVMASGLLCFEEFFLLDGPEVLFPLSLTTFETARSRQLLLERSLLRLSCLIRLDIVLFEVIKHLAWDFFQSLASQRHRIVRKVTIRNELHNVRRHMLPIPL